MARGIAAYRGAASREALPHAAPRPPGRRIARTMTSIAVSEPVQPHLQNVPWWMLPTHVVGVALVQSTWMASQFILPVIARKEFGAGPVQTLLITATPTIFFALSIFWNDLFRRRPFAKYLGIYWLWACLPYAFIAFAHDYWTLLALHLLTCIGGAGYHPAAGELLKELYPDSVRGRIYGIIWGSSMVFGAGIGYLMGQWLAADHDAFRIYMPLFAALQAVGVGVFILLAHASGHLARRTYDQAQDDRTAWKRVVEPMTHMKEVLKSDPVFMRYEAAYMTYGVGWMICYALLPILVTDRLHLSYDKIQGSTYTAYLLAMVAMIFPTGLLMDRIGAVRTAAISFGLLSIYPLGLIVAGDAAQLTWASIAFGVAHAGASMAWMLGPVSLAPTPDKVPQYVAIHATLVGVRGKIFQGLGVGLYMLTHSFTIPLLIAAAAYAWSAVQMWRLNERMRQAKAK